MRHYTAAFTLCVFAAGISACADEVAAPEMRGVALPETVPYLAMMQSNGTIQESGVALFVNDYSEYFDCLGETVHMHMEVPFRWKLTTTPSGNVIDVEPLLQGQGTGHAEGLASGRIWTATHFVGPLKAVEVGAEAGSFGLDIDWASAAGPNWAMHDTYYYTITPAGTLTAIRFRSRCVLKGSPA
jgi:hypothetical protein